MRLIQYGRWGGYIRDIQAVGSVMRTRDLDGTDQLEFTALTDVSKGDRVVAVDSMGRVCEWEVSSVDAVREDGAPALDVACVAGYGELSLAWIDELQNTGYSAASCLEKALDGTRWTAGACESGTLASTATTSWYHESVSDALDDICDTYGLELEARYELDSTGTYVAARYIDLYEQRGADNGKRFAYGKDLTGVRRTVGSTRPITRCYGYGKGVECADEETGETTGGYSRKITFADVNDGYEYVDAGDEYLALWGVPGPDGEMLPACGVFEDGDCEDESVLLAETIAYLEEACEPSVSYTCDVAALGRAGMDAEGVDVGDTVQIIDTTFPTPLRLTGRVTRLVEDMAGGEPTEVTLGSVVDSLAAQASANAAALETVLSNSAAWNSAAAGSNVYISDLIARINELMNATGGYVYLTADEGIYVYDLPVDESPTQCIHIGGGYWRCANSKTSAGEWDWQTMADGSGLYADALYTGVLSDAAGENWWNLDTGELSISAGSTIGDYTVSELTVAVEGITSTVESAVTEQVSALSATYLTADELTEVLTDYVSGTSLADALAAYVTDDDLSDALESYATVTYVTTNYSTTEQTATAITTTVAEELTAYATIEYVDEGDDVTIGGRNLLPDTRDMSTWGSASTYVTETDDEGFGIFVAPASDTSKWMGVASRGYGTSSEVIPYSLVRGKTVVFSVEFMTDGSADITTSGLGVPPYCDFCVTTSTSTTSRGSYRNTKSSAMECLTDYSTSADDLTSWQRVSYRFTADDSFFSADSGSPIKEFSDDCGFYVYLQSNPAYTGVAGYEVRYRKPKLEIGDVATDWSPAPEDAETYTDDAVDAATTTITEAYTSAIEQTANSITSTVAATYATIEYSDEGDADALADAESYADSAVNSATTTITEAYTSAIEQTANSITSIVEAQTGSNLLQDGGFEAPDYWTGLRDGMFLDSDDPHSGTYCMACTGGSNLIYLNHPCGEDAATSKTPVTVTPGRTYRVEAWVKASDDAVWESDNTKVRIAELDGSLVTALDTDASLVEAGGGWTYLSMEWDNDDCEEVYVQLAQKVSSGTFWFDDVRVELDTATSSEVSSAISQLADSVTTTVESYLYDTGGDAVYALASELEQTADSLTASLSSLSETVDGNWDTVTAYMSFSQDSDGDPLLVLGSSSSDASVELSNDRLSFMSGDEEVAYISDEELYITNVEVTGSLEIGGFVWEAMSDGSFQIRKADA